MDGTLAIEKNRVALKRILAAMLAMAGLGAGGQVTFFPQEGAPPQDKAPAGRLSPAFTLPRHLYLAVLSLLRPAEAAARRLVIAAARGVVVTLPPPRPRRPKPRTTSAFLRRPGGTGILLPGALPLPRRAAHRCRSRTRSGRGKVEVGRGVSCALPLFDPPRRLPRPARPAVSGVPRISVPGFGAPFAAPLRRPRSPDEPVDATRLGLRLAALARALDDLPGQAIRFARWRARRDAADKAPPGRVRRLSPLRSGRPPGGRLARFDPFATRRRTIREIDEILAHAHALAVEALVRPDTS